MANNRLYVADRLNKEYIFIENGWGFGWTGGHFDSELFTEFISSRNNEGDLQSDTNLFFFTEQSLFYDEIIESYKQYKTDNNSSKLYTQIKKYMKLSLKKIKTIVLSIFYAALIIVLIMVGGILATKYPKYAVGAVVVLCAILFIRAIYLIIDDSE